MKRIFFIFSILSLVLLGACTASSTGPALVVATLEGQYANNGVEIKKEASACQYNILGLVNFGDSSIQQTTGTGNITNVGTVDRDYLSIFGLFSKSCLIIRGN